MSSRLTPFLARHHRHPLARGLAALCRRYLAAYGNHDYELHRNGEAFVLHTLGRLAPQLILDVGANVGDWTLAARAACPEARLIAFEISPPTVQRLHQRLAGTRGVQVQAMGLSDVPGTVRIRHCAAVPTLTTATDYPHPFEFTDIEAPVSSGDVFAAEQGIGHIDFLKIDVEGMEEKVLRGFDGLLSRRAIDLVQFEYGRVAILNHFLLADSHAFFQQRGYSVGKIYPGHVDFRPYDMADEDFLGPNYLACRSDRADLLQALAGGAAR